MIISIETFFIYIIVNSNLSQITSDIHTTCYNTNNFINNLSNINNNYNFQNFNHIPNNFGFNHLYNNFNNYVLFNRNLNINNLQYPN